MDYKIYLGYLAIAIGFASYGRYFWDIYQGKIKPHAFSWFVWGTLTGIGFAAITAAGGRAWCLGNGHQFCVVFCSGWQRLLAALGEIRAIRLAGPLGRLVGIVPVVADEKSFVGHNSYRYFRHNRLSSDL